MSEIIVLLIFLFFAVCGVSTICAKLWLWLIRPHNKRKSVAVINVDGEENDENFMFSMEKYRWYGNDYADYLVFVTEGKISEKAGCYIKENKNMFCVNNEGLYALLKKLTEDGYERR